MSKCSRAFFIFLGLLDISVVIIFADKAFFDLISLASSEPRLLNLFRFDACYMILFSLTLFVSAGAQIFSKRWLLPVLVLQFPGRIYFGLLSFQLLYSLAEGLPYSLKYIAVALFVLAPALEAWRLYVSASLFRKNSEKAPSFKKYIYLSGLLLLLGLFQGGQTAYQKFYATKASAHLTGNPERLKDVLANNPGSLNKVNKANETLLHEALLYGNDASAKILIEKGAALDVKDRLGNTPLHYAAQSLEISKLLLSRGANINAQNNDGQTPLHKAIEYGSRAVYLHLTEQGANAEIKDKQGKTAPESAKIKGFSERGPVKSD